MEEEGPLKLSLSLPIYISSTSTSRELETNLSQTKWTPMMMGPDDGAIGSSSSEKRQRSVDGEERSDEDDGEMAAKKKLRLSKEQSAVLEESFREHNTLNPKQKLVLAKKLNLKPRQVEVWFQNRRARTKLKQTEVDCELLKKCCKNLTEENRRLQRELVELRSLKRSPHLFMQVPATTLTLCPTCETARRRRPQIRS